MGKSIRKGKQKQKKSNDNQRLNKDDMFLCFKWGAY